MTITAATQPRVDPDNLAREHFGFAKSIAFKMRAPGDDIDDITGDALLGLAEAISRYDPALGVKFTAYAGTRIAGAIIDGRRTRDVMPRLIRNRERQIHATVEHLRDTLHRHPTHQEIANHLGIAVDHLDRERQAIHAATHRSLDQELPLDDHGTATLYDQVADPRGRTAEEHALATETRDRLDRAISRLPAPQRMVLSLSYHAGMSLAEIAQVLQVTPSRISQIRSAARDRLRLALVDVH